MTQELKPCPFCGGEKSSMHPPTCRPETPYNPTDRLFPIVRCNRCFAECLGENEDYSGASAIAAWNTRARPSADADAAGVVVKPFMYAVRQLEDGLPFFDEFCVSQEPGDLEEHYEDDASVEVIPLYAQPPALVVTATHHHVKRGTEYVLIGIGKMQAGDWQRMVPNVQDGAPGYTMMPVDMAEVAIYRSATDPTEIWVRPREEFEDGRFEIVEDAE